MAITPIIQFDPRECGPAALAMLLAHHGRPVPLAQLALACQVEANGSTAGRLLQVARDYGLPAKAVRPTPALLRQTQTPWIAHWQADHFVVVEALEGGQVHLIDPAYGRRTLSEADFARDFSGVALLFPAPDSPLPQPPTNPAAVSDDPLVLALQAGVQGAVGWLPYQTGRFHHDFGHLYQRTPRVVVRAVCEADIIHTLQVARQTGVPVVTRGAGHARRGQSLTEGGILLVNFLDAPVAQWQMVSETEVEITTRSRWAAVEQALNHIGRAIPTLPAYGHLSVGGTLSVGGYGERSIHYGPQIHQVRRLRLLLPDGTAVNCSPQENEELFRYSLAGLGQVGVIEKVVMTTIPRPQLTEPFYYRHSSTAAFVQSLAHLAAEPAGTIPHFAGYILKDKGCYSEFRYPAGTQLPAPAGAESVPERPAFRGQDALDDGYRLAADFLFDHAGLAAYLDFLQEAWRTTPLGRYTDWALLLAVRADQSTFTFPFEAAPATRPPVAFLVGLYPIIPLNDPEGLAAVQALFSRALHYAIQLGGRPYLYGSHQLDEATRLALYGESYQRLQALRQQLDPQRLLNGHSL